MVPTMSYDCVEDGQYGCSSYSEGNHTVEMVNPFNPNVTGAGPPNYFIRTTNILRYVVLGLYLVTFIFGAIGNSLTIAVIWRSKKLKTVATCFILNLAVADNLFMFSLPFMAHNSIARTWIFGPVMCKILSALLGINQYASIFTMVLMSIDRYLAVVWPLRSMQYRTMTNAVIVCILVWIVCFIIMSPYWLYATTHTGMDSSRTDKTTCRLFWPPETFWQHEWFWANFQVSRNSADW